MSHEMSVRNFFLARWNLVDVLQSLMPIVIGQEEFHECRNRALGRLTFIYHCAASVVLITFFHTKSHRHCVDKPTGLCGGGGVFLSCVVREI